MFTISANVPPALREDGGSTKAVVRDKSTHRPPVDKHRQTNHAQTKGRQKQIQVKQRKKDKKTDT
jgi:hypothetical protein